MNDEETVAPIVGGHTFGKTCMASLPPSGTSVREPEGARPRGPGPRLEEQVRNWQYHTITSGLEGAWTTYPTQWDNGFLENLFKYEWERLEEPAYAEAVEAEEPRGPGHRAGCARPEHARHAPMMLTTTLALKVDPIYATDRETLPRQLNSARRRVRPERGSSCSTATWVPARAISGPWVPEPQLWQDPVPAVDHELVGETRMSPPSSARSSTSACPSLIRFDRAWNAAASFRGTDKRGGANEPRSAFAPQKDWEANEPARPSAVLKALERIQQDFNQSQSGGKKVSGRPDRSGDACRRRGGGPEGRAQRDQVLLAPGRTDALQEQTDVDTFEVLEPVGDGFRNYPRAKDPLSPRPGCSIAPTC